MIFVKKLFTLQSRRCVAAYTKAQSILSHGRAILKTNDMKMKKLMIAAALLCAAVTASAANCTIEGKIGNLNAPAKIMMRYALEDGSRSQETVLSDGSFTFSFDVTQPVWVSLIINYDNAPFLRDTRNLLTFYADAGTVKVTSPDSLHHAVVEAPIITQWQDYIAKTAPTMIQIDSLLGVMRLAEPRETRTTPEFLAKQRQAGEKMYAELRERQKEYIRNNPSSFFSVIALGEVFGNKPDVAQATPYFEMLSPEMRDTWQARKFAGRLDVSDRIANGNPAPDFTLEDTNGKQVSLSDFRGKYLMLDFMGSWCQSCRREMPRMKAAYEKYKDRGLVAMSVFIESRKQPDLWKKVIQTDGMPWTCVVDWQPEMPVAKNYGITGVPRVMIISPEGVIVRHDVKAAALDQVLDEILPK